MGQRAKSKLLVDEGNEILECVAFVSKNFERAIKWLNTRAKGKPSNLKNFTWHI